VADLEGLYSTTSHAVRDVEFFRTCKGVNFLTEVEATAIDRLGKKLKVRHIKDGKEEELEYDNLVIATGATPIRPPFPGADLPGVITVSNLHNAKEIKDKISKGQVEKAVVIGAGAIGIEMAEALTDLWGVETTIIEMADQVLPVAIGRNMARVVENRLMENNVQLMLAQRVEKINGDNETGVRSVETSAGTVECDLVILSAGVRPNTEFAARAGLAVGRSGGLLVDECLRTTDPSIYAGGDCIELRNMVSGGSQTMPLGSLANRQGRIIATNINGGSSRFKGTVGTFCIKVFDLGVATAGLTAFQAGEAGFDPVHAVVSQHDRAHFYPTSQLMYMEIVADRRSRKVLGIEAVGGQGDAVKARVDSIATLLKDEIDVDEVCSVEIGYAPPFASAMDIVNNVGNALDNILAHKNVPIDPIDFIRDFKQGKTRVLDVRGAKEASHFIEKYGEQWINIPQAELRERIGEVPTDERLCLLCDTGPRSYEAQLVLAANGIDNTRNIQGGYAMLLVTDSEFVG